MFVRRMLPAKSTDQSGVRLAGFAHSIVTAVKVLALFELVLKQVLLVWQLAVETEELLLLFRELL